MPCASPSLLLASGAAVAGFVLTVALRRHRQKRGAAAATTLQPERDLIGYGAEPPKVCWPGGAMLAVNVVLNVEEGSEPAMPDGDPDS